ncbi:putative secreted lipase [Colletotrichum sp. SAR 10_86]|nr:putative secreted lipase [Colletotrichum sp. SAR 10_65]KAI8221159.1 putative secreted lipase [Colletotrichum sp. SAR 10_86]
MAPPPKDDAVSVVESLDVKSSVSGSDVSTKSPPKPLPILLSIAMFLLFIASGGGLTTSALQFRPSRSGKRDCLTQSFILFASMISPMYLVLHLFVSFRNCQFVRRQSLQSPLVSWAIIVSRLALLLWIPAIILSCGAVAHFPGFLAESPITELNLAVSIVGIASAIVVVLVLEIAAHPFELPCFKRATTVILVEDADKEAKPEEEPKPPSRPPSRQQTPPAYYYFPASYRHTVPAPARAKLVRKASYPKHLMAQNVPPVPAMPYPHPDSLGIMLPIPEPLPPLPELEQTNPKPKIKITPAPPDILIPGKGLPADKNKPCPPPPGTAWARDWEQLAVDAGVRRNGSSPEPWTEPLDATEFGPACHQNFELGPRPELLQTLFNTPKAPESEDCLRINVFAPDSTSNATRAVLVFIHGGGYQMGHARIDLSPFAAYEDIIVVSLQYRTNVFGFPSSRDIPIPERNLGLYDQRFAFDWIQQNIEAFGGDPGKVTIWGQSAGALSVDQHLKAYATELPIPFRAAIMSSGQASFGLLASPSPSDGKEWSALAAAVGCANSTGGLECMKKIPAEDLVEAMSKHSISFGPELDYVTVWGNPAELWRSGQVTRVPILTGTVAEEGRGLVNDEVDLASWLEAYLPVGLIKEEDRQPQSILSTTAASHKIPSWRYYFNTSILNFFPEEYAWLGKFHGSEAILLFTDPNNTTYTPQSYAVYEYLRGAIGRFVKDPNAGPGWPAVGSQYAPLDLVVLGDVGNVQTAVTPFNTTILDERCGLYKGIYSKLEAMSS